MSTASKIAPDSDPKSETRNFYSVLEDLLADFDYDLKSGQVSGLKDVSVRDIVVSENVPASFRTHLELLISERILRNTKTRIVNCTACRSKRASLSGGNILISRPEANSAELGRIAKMNNIQNFLDVAYAYQPSGMILSLHIYDSETGTMMWSRSYNSETSRAAAFRRGVDPSQDEEARTKNEYVPTIQIRPALYTIITPKPGSGSSTALALGFRMVERYDNRKKEVGFEMNYYMDYSNLVGLSSGTNTLYSGFNTTLLFHHAWNLIGDEENYNIMRGSVFGAIGGTYASGFLGAVVRGGYEWRFAKRWSMNVLLGLRPKATAVLPTAVEAAVSGIEGGVGVGYLF